MKTYQVTYTLLASGCIEVQSTSASAAEELIYEFDTQSLLDNADFDNSLEVEFIEEM